jgi:hypothetical protein
MGTRNRVGIGLLYQPARARICKPFKEPGIDSQPGGPVRQPYLLYRLARLHRLAEMIPLNRFLGSLNVYKYGLRLHWLTELVPWNRFLGSLNFYKYGLRLHWLGGIGSLESIPGLLKRLQIWAQATLAGGIGSLESIPGLLKRL